MKNVLIIYYSQSGQLESIARNISKPLLDSNEVNITFHEIEMAKPFPFPWAKDAFFDAFPESFLQISAPIKPMDNQLANSKFDLILFHYQVWYLSPSIPTNSFLKSAEAKVLLDGAKIVTVSGSRNMWIMAQEKVKTLLKVNNSQLKGNIALVDRTGNLISVITIVEWMFSGIKKKYLGIFPMPGVAEKDIVESSKFGDVILKALRDDNWDNLQNELVAIDAVKISSYLVRVDKTANKIFDKWSKLIHARPQSRKKLLKFFNLYLWLAIWLISPIVYIVHILTYPANINRIKKDTYYYQDVK
jgi:hypothetical protein